MIDIDAIREMIVVCQQSVKEIKKSEESYERWKITRRYIMDNYLEWLTQLCDEIDALKNGKDISQ